METKIIKDKVYELINIESPEDLQSGDYIGELGPFMHWAEIRRNDIIKNKYNLALKVVGNKIWRFKDWATKRNLNKMAHAAGTTIPFPCEDDTIATQGWVREYIRNCPTDNPGPAALTKDEVDILKNNFYKITEAETDRTESSKPDPKVYTYTEEDIILKRDVNPHLGSAAVYLPVGDYKVIVIKG